MKKTKSPVDQTHTSLDETAWKVLKDTKDYGEAESTDAEILAEIFLSLDHYLSRGGDLPQTWKRHWTKKKNRKAADSSASLELLNPLRVLEKFYEKPK